MPGNVASLCSFCSSFAVDSQVWLNFWFKVVIEHARLPFVCLRETNSSQHSNSKRSIHHSRDTCPRCWCDPVDRRRTCSFADYYHQSGSRVCRFACLSRIECLDNSIDWIWRIKRKSSHSSRRSLICRLKTISVHIYLTLPSKEVRWEAGAQAVEESIIRKDKQSSLSSFPGKRRNSVVYSFKLGQTSSFSAR